LLIPFFKKIEKLNWPNRARTGNTLVVMDKNDKIQEGQVQINDLDNYKPLNKPIVKETHKNVSRVISKLHRGNYLDDMTRTWLSQTPNPLRIPEFYTLSGCSGPTERISAFVGTLLQPIHHKRLIRRDRLAQLVERRTTEREVSGSNLRPDQHSGS